MALKQDAVYLCPTQGNKIESVVIRDVLTTGMENNIFLV